MPPRGAGDLRAQLVRWCVAAHERMPRVTFDALDGESRGLLAASDLRALCAPDFFERPFSKSEVDVLMHALDDDGSGCVDAAEFKGWLDGAQLADLVVSDDEDGGPEEAAAAGGDVGEKRGASGAFAVAAFQLRGALLARCGLPGGAASGEDRRRVRDLLKSEFVKIDSDGSGQIDEAEFEALVASMGVDIVDKEPKAVDLVALSEVLLVPDGGPFASLDVLGLVLEERVASRRERTLRVAAVRRDSAAEACGFKGGDDLVKVCGVDLAALAAGLDEEFVDHHPLDALTEKANRALGDAPVASISAKRRTGQHEGDSTSLQFERSRSNSL